MKKLIFGNKINLLFLFISLICLPVVLGIENISFQSIKWLYNGDKSLSQLGWYFFLNDIWRFPLGSNPNYGEELGSSIVYTDSIPILALFFKSFKSFLPEDFQYYSFWHFICFYFQLFFSFKILKKFTNSVPYSLIGSFFFLITPIFIFRVNFNPSIAGQWLLLFALYLGLTKIYQRGILIVHVKKLNFLIKERMMIIYKNSKFTVLLLTITFQKLNYNMIYLMKKDL